MRIKHAKGTSACRWTQSSETKESRTGLSWIIRQDRAMGVMKEYFQMYQQDQNVNDFYWKTANEQQEQEWKKGMKRTTEFSE